MHVMHMTGLSMAMHIKFLVQPKLWHITHPTLYIHQISNMQKHPLTVLREYFTHKSLSSFALM